jgi:excisionase family DNA binding protein
MSSWSESVLRAVTYQRVPVFSIHYACEDWKEVGTGLTPRVTAIAIHVLGQDLNRLYSLALMAEREQVPASELPTRAGDLERMLLEEFGCFLERMRERYANTHWFHWAMRDTTFGWPLLEHRHRTLMGRGLPIEEEQLVDFHAVLAQEYGPDFVPRPRFLNLVKRNGLDDPELLPGAEEAVAHQRGDYRVVSRSTAKKAEALGRLVVKYIRRELVTDAPPRKKVRRLFRVPQEVKVPRYLVGPHEAAKICGVSRATWYRLLAEGKIPAPRKIGRRSLWLEPELREWAAALGKDRSEG